MAFLKKQEHLEEIEILKVTLDPYELKVLDYFIILNILPSELSQEVKLILSDGQEILTSNLPILRLKVSFPTSYPENGPPEIEIMSDFYSNFDLK